MEPAIKVSVDEGAITIAFNRPDKRNALNVEMGEAILAALERFRATAVPVVFRSLTPGMFVAGSDVTDIKDRSVEQSLARTTAGLCQRIEDHPWPTIAVVEGYALGGGCELALACDFRISSASAKWGFPEVRLGIIPGAGGLSRLAPLVGWGNAIDLIMTGRRINATEAKALGLIQRVAEDGTTDAEVDGLLDDLAKGSPFARRVAKEAMRVDGDRMRLVDAAVQALCIANDDARARMDSLVTRLDK